MDTTTHTMPFLPDHEFPDGVPIIWTTDERDHEHPAKPFPNLEYLQHYVHALVSTEEENQKLLIDKARQMMATTGALLAWDYWALHEESRRFLWSKVSQEEAADQLNEKVRAVHTRLPRWIQDAHPISPKPYHRILYPNTGSKFIAINENAAAGAARGGTATAIGVDEAAYINFLKQIWVAAQPMAAKIVALTTPNLVVPGSSAEFFYEKISPGRVYRRAKPRLLRAA